MNKTTGRILLAAVAAAAAATALVVIMLLIDAGTHVSSQAAPTPCPDSIACHALKRMPTAAR